MPKKLCIITSWFPDAKRPFLAPFVYQFAKNLSNRGLNVSIITTLGEGDARSVNSDNLTIYRVNKWFPFFPMLRIINHLNPDIIHVHAPNQFSTGALLIGRLKRIPVIATVHRAEVDSTNVLLSLARRIVLSKYRHVVAVSKYSMKLATNSGVKASNIQVIYNSCNESLFKLQSKLDARKSNNLPYKEKIILFVGNLIEVKGVYVLIDTLNILKNRLNFHAVVIGRGKDEELIKKYAASMSILNKISFVGFIAQQELSSYYNAADVFVLPSYTEGNSVAILEAMYLGIPIVASNTGGNPEIISNGVNGYLATVGNALEFSQRIEQILIDRGLQILLSKNCIEIYREKFSNKKQIDQYLRLYNDILEMNQNK